MKKEYAHSSIGARLAHVIGDLGLTRTGFADFVGLPYRTIQNYLRDEREPNADALKKFINARINVVWLLTGEGEPFLTDYLRKEIVDKLLILLFSDVIDLCFKKGKGGFSETQRAELLSYLASDSQLGLADAIQILLDEGAIKDVAGLAQWKEYLKDVAHPQVKRRKRISRASEF